MDCSKKYGYFGRPTETGGQFSSGTLIAARQVVSFSFMLSVLISRANPSYISVGFTFLRLHDLRFSVCDCWERIQKDFSGPHDWKRRHHALYVAISPIEPIAFFDLL